MGLLSIGNRLSSAVLAQSGPACADLPEYQAIKGQGKPAPVGTWARNNGVKIVEGDGLANAMFAGGRQDISEEALRCIRDEDNIRFEPGLLRRLFDQPWVDQKRYQILLDLYEGRLGPPAVETAPPPPPPPPAPAEVAAVPPPAVPPETGVVTIPGLVVTDAFVAMNADMNLRRPSSSSQEATIGGRSLRGTEGISLSLAQIGLEWRPGPNSRIHTEVIGGVDEQIMNAEGLGGNKAGLWEFFGEQTFDNGYTLQIGRFATLVGSEVPGPRNPTISNSFLFDSQPLSHIGLMTSGHTGPLTIAAGISNGADIVFTPEFLPTGHFKVAGTPTDGMNLSLQAFIGPQPVDDGTESRGLYDLVWDYRPTPKDRVMLNADYGANDHIGEPWLVASAQWYGAAAYYQRELGPYRLAARLEGVHQNGDKNDAGTGPLWLGAGTLTAGRAFREHVQVRFEYRHDVATAPYYPRQAGGLTETQDTGAMELAIQF